MTDEQLNTVANYIAFAAAIPAVANAAIYGIGSPWFRSWLGRVIFAKWLSVALVFIFITIRRFFGDFSGYGVWAVCLFSFFTLAFAATTVELIIERRAGPLDPHLAVPKERKLPMSHVELTPATVPEIWYKAQRVLRTLVAVGIPTFLTFAGILPLIIEALGLPADSTVRLWLLGVATGITGVALAITRIMAIPAVNAWLTRVGLGSVPKSAIVAPQAVKVDPVVAENERARIADPDKFIR